MANNAMPSDHAPDAHAFLRRPTPGPWSETLAQDLVRSTAQAMDQRLGWAADWDEWAAAQCPVAYQTWETAWEAINQAWRDRDRVALARACIAWWQAARIIADARRASDSLLSDQDASKAPA